MNAIHIALLEDDYCKSYEGCFEILVEYPNYFEDEEGKIQHPSAWIITLHCYILGPERHYDWMGKTLSEAFAKCKPDVEKMIAEYEIEI
jgi:hypothetical protein